MAENHIIIGLGGTGGNTIAAFKRLLFENKNGELDSSKYGVDCIYVDSSSDDLKMKNPQWRIMGTDISLGRAQVLEIESQPINQYVQNAASFPNLKYWIGESTDWKDILKDIGKQAQAGAQRRKLGRFNFALKSGEFVSLVNSRVSLLKDLASSDFTLKFHVCTGLAGGTGSGSVVDVCALLRKTYPDCTINLYAVLPETNPGFQGVPSAYYHANGYAALLELNAMGYGSFRPYDISNKMQVNNEKIGGALGFKGNPPFNLCYLLADMNEADFPLSPNSTEKMPVGSLIQNLAEYIFQTTVITNPKIASAVHRAEKMENPPKSPVTKFGFSNSFFSFGYKRFAIPEQEIKEYFAYLFGYQALLQFLYNNFNKAEGYLDRTTSQSYNSIVSNNEFLVKYHITRDQLILSKDILSQYSKEIKEKDIETLFMEAMAVVTNKVMQGSGMDGRPVIKEQWLDAILIWGNVFFDKSFRAIGQDGGVKSFYDTKTRDKDNLAKKIVDNIENEIFKEWHSGVKSIDQVHGIITALNVYIKEEKEKYNAEIAKNIQTIKALEQAILRIKEDWRPGVLNSIFNDDEGKVKDTQKNVTDLLILKTKNIGYVYAQELIDSIVPKLNNLITNVSTINGYFNTIKKTFQNEHLTRCVDDENSGKTAVLIKYYEPEIIKAFAKKLVINEAILNERISALREVIYSIAKDSGNFFEKLKKINVDEIQSLLENESMKLSQIFFSDSKTVAKVSDEKFINQNILQKLKDDFSGEDEKLKEKLTFLVKQAALSSKFDTAQGLDNSSSTDERATMVIIPENIGDPNFNDKFSQLLKNISSKCELGIGGNLNEILIFNVKRGAQAREFVNVAYLKERYDALMNMEGDTARFVCHIEDLILLPEEPSEEIMGNLIESNKDQSIIYSLYAPTEEEKKKRSEDAQKASIPFLLLGKASGIVIDAVNKETGKNVLCLMRKTAVGDDPIILGFNLTEALEKLNDENSHILISQTEKRLKENYMHISTHEELIQKIKLELDQLQQSHNNNPFNPIVKKFKESGLKAIEILNNLN